MKQNIELSIQVPNPSYKLKILSVYQAKDKLIAISEMMVKLGLTAEVISTTHDQFEVDLKDAARELPVSHYVINEEGGWWAKSQNFTHIKKQQEIADLIKDLPRCEKLEIKEIKSEQKSKTQIEPQKETNKEQTVWYRENKMLAMGLAGLTGVVGLFSGAYKLMSDRCHRSAETVSDTTSNSIKHKS